MLIMRDWKKARLVNNAHWLTSVAGVAIRRNKYQDGWIKAYRRRVLLDCTSNLWFVPDLPFTFQIGSGVGRSACGPHFFAMSPECMHCFVALYPMVVSASSSRKYAGYSTQLANHSLLGRPTRQGTAATGSHLRIRHKNAMPQTLERGDEIVALAFTSGCQQVYGSAKGKRKQYGTLVAEICPLSQVLHKRLCPDLLAGTLLDSLHFPWRYLRHSLGVPRKRVSVDARRCVSKCAQTASHVP